MKIDNDFLIKQTNEMIDLFEKQKEERYKLGKKDGAIAELEKIKTELQNPKEIGLDFFDGLDYAEEVIDKHIAELKGENNETNN